MRWVAFWAVALWLSAVSIRLGLDEFDHAVYLDKNYIPFGLAPFSNVLYDDFLFAETNTPRHVVTVDGKPFLGASTYLRALHRQPDLGIHEDTRPVRTFRAHCSCPVSLENTILIA